MNEIFDIITNGLIPELQDFFTGINWTYTIMYIIILYGIEYKSEFIWYVNIFKKYKIELFINWITGLLIGITFVFFKLKQNELNWEYISSLLRSWLLVIVFSSIFIDLIIKIIRKISSDTKEKKNE